MVRGAGHVQIRNPKAETRKKSGSSTFSVKRGSWSEVPTSKFKAQNKLQTTNFSEATESRSCGAWALRSEVFLELCVLNFELLCFPLSASEVAEGVKTIRTSVFGFLSFGIRSSEFGSQSCRFVRPSARWKPRISPGKAIPFLVPRADQKTAGSCVMSNAQRENRWERIR